jgi:hypothetical protein
MTDLETEVARSLSKKPKRRSRTTDVALYVVARSVMKITMPQAKKEK